MNINEALSENGYCQTANGKETKQQTTEISKKGSCQTFEKHAVFRMFIKKKIRQLKKKNAVKETDNKQQKNQMNAKSDVPNTKWHPIYERLLIGLPSMKSQLKFTDWHQQKFHKATLNHSLVTQDKTQHTHAHKQMHSHWKRERDRQRETHTHTQTAQNLNTKFLFQLATKGLLTLT